MRKEKIQDIIAVLTAMATFIMMMVCFLRPFNLHPLTYYEIPMGYLEFLMLAVVVILASILMAAIAGVIAAVMIEIVVYFLTFLGKKGEKVMERIKDFFQEIKDLLGCFYRAFVYDLYHKGEVLVWVKKWGKKYVALLKNEGELNPTGIIIWPVWKEFMLFTPTSPIEIWDTGYSLNHSREYPFPGEFIKNLSLTKTAGLILSASERFLSPRAKKRALDALESIAHLFGEREYIEYLRVL